MSVTDAATFRIGVRMTEPATIFPCCPHAFVRSTMLALPYRQQARRLPDRSGSVSDIG